MPNTERSIVPATPAETNLDVSSIRPLGPASASESAQKPTLDGFRSNLHLALEGKHPSWPWKLMPHWIGALVTLNVVAVVAESHGNWSQAAMHRFELFELVSIVVFSLEYVLRIWSCVEDPRYQRPVLGRLRFAVTPLALVDLLAIIPAFIPSAAFDLRSARTLRLIRIMRLLKLGRYSKSLKSFANVFRESTPELVSCLIVMLVLLVTSSSIMYFAEREAQPDAFSSITATLWWGIATMSTVGYGDVYPVTALGKLVGSVVALLGIGFFALPAGIITTNYMKAIGTDARKASCPHCGQSLDSQGGD